ncbi:MAG: hypothetical protein N4A37_03650 [Prolixibacteraceae bacterium]|jgi:hypothetical protein|nr:hypothetical protein [Prolixibacteraceae bacterium]
MTQARNSRKRIVAGAIMLLYFFSVWFAHLSHSNFHCHDGEEQDAHSSCHITVCHHNHFQQESNKEWKATSHLCKWFKYLHPQLHTSATTIGEVKEVCWTVTAPPIIFSPSKRIEYIQLHRGPPCCYNTSFTHLI